MHVSCAVVGEHRWRALVTDLVRTATRLERLTGRRCVTLDVGGGGYPEDLNDTVDWLRSHMASVAHQELPELNRILIEPGRALVQDWMAVMTTVLEVRCRAGRIEAVIDTSISDLPEAAHFPHRMLRLCPSGWHPISSPGADRVLGSTCMEADILVDRVLLPVDLAVGDTLLVLDAGAYDRSMAYDFARG